MSIDWTALIFSLIAAIVIGLIGAALYFMFVVKRQGSKSRKQFKNKKGIIENKTDVPKDENTIELPPKPLPTSEIKPSGEILPKPQEIIPKEEKIPEIPKISQEDDIKRFNRENKELEEAKKRYEEGKMSYEDLKKLFETIQGQDYYKRMAQEYQK